MGLTVFLGQSYEIAPDGTTTTYVFAGSQRVAALDSTGAIRFYHADHLGSSHVITDGAGKVLELTEHTPYGSLARHEGTANVPHKFTGQRLDASTGLYFYASRYYDPSLGRFLQADPIVLSPGDPQALNRYSYVRNNPLRYIDPTGFKWSWKKFFGIVAIVAAVVVTAGVAAPAIAGAAGAVGAAVGGGIGAGIEAGIGAAASFAAAAVPYAAIAGVASGTGFFLTPGSASSGFAATVGAAAAVSGTVLGAGPGLVASAVLGNAGLQGGVTYVGMRLLDTPLAQEGIGRAAGALERVGMSRGAALLFASVAAGAVVFGGLSSVAQASALSGEVVQRAMSRAELEATRETGLLRGGREGTHYVSDAVNSSANRARLRLSLRQTPEVRVTLEVPEGRFSAPSPVDAMYGMPGGGMERTATGKIPVKILRVDEY